MRSVTLFTERIKNRHNPERDTPGNIKATEVTWAEADLARALESLAEDVSEQLAGLGARVDGLAGRVAGQEIGADYARGLSRERAVIQYVDPDDFVQALRDVYLEIDRPVTVRTWAGSIKEPRHEGLFVFVTHMIVLQILTAEAIHNMSVWLGSYSLTGHNEPLRPSDGLKRSIIGSNADRARERVEKWVAGMANVKIRGGRINLPGLSPKDLDLAKLHRLEPLYEALENGEAEGDVFDDREAVS